MAGILLSFVIIIGAYIKKFSSDFKDEDKQKLILFVLFIIALSVVLAFLRA